jgi:hypothetical protein
MKISFFYFKICSIHSRKNKTSKEVLVIPRTDSYDSVSVKESEGEVKPDLEDNGTDLPEFTQECVAPVLDKNETVVSNDIQFFDKFCIIFTCHVKDNSVIYFLTIILQGHRPYYVCVGVI